MNPPTCYVLATALTYMKSGASSISELLGCDALSRPSSSGKLSEHFFDHNALESVTATLQICIFQLK